MARKGTSKTPEMVTRLVDIGVKRLVEQLNVAEEPARALMRDVAHDLCREWGGNDMYVPKNEEFELSERDRQIWAEFTGFNGAELASRYGLSVRQVRYIIALVSRRETRNSQHELPGLEA